MCVQYIRGCSVHQRDTISSSVDVQCIGGFFMLHMEGYHEYVGGCSVHWEIP